MGKRYRTRVARAQSDAKLRQSVGNFAEGVTGHLKEIANMVGITQAVTDGVVEALSAHLGVDFEAKVREILERKSEEARKRAQAEEEDLKKDPDLKEDAIRQIAEAVATSNAQPDMVIVDGEVLVKRCSCCTVHPVVEDGIYGNDWCSDCLTSWSATGGCDAERHARAEAMKAEGEEV